MCAIISCAPPICRITYALAMNLRIFYNEVFPPRWLCAKLRLQYFFSAASKPSPPPPSLTTAPRSELHILQSSNRLSNQPLSNFLLTNDQCPSFLFLLVLADLRRSSLGDDYFNYFPFLPRSIL
jgi:hypothetical protein